MLFVVLCIYMLTYYAYFFYKHIEWFFKPFFFILEFIDSTVVYNIKSPTVDLSNVFFPSLVVCNLNILRRSFIISLLNETKIDQNIDFVQLHSLINNFFLSGGNSVNDQDIIDSKAHLKSNVDF